MAASKPRISILLNVQMDNHYYFNVLNQDKMLFYQISSSSICISFFGNYAE